MKKIIFPFLCCAMLFLVSTCQPQKTYPGQIYRFDLKQIAKTTSLSHKWVKNAEFGEKVLSVAVSNGNNELVLTTDSENIDWAAAKYLVCEVWHDNPYSVLARLQFFRRSSDEIPIVPQGMDIGAEPGLRMICNLGILPKLKTQMIFPLSHLDGQQIYLSRQPRQLKGTALGWRIEPDEVGKFSIRFMPDMEPDFLPEIQIASVYLTAELPEPYEKPAVAVIDSFGQWTARDWHGKVHSAGELKTSMAKTETIAASAALPDDWSIYGGWKQLQFKPKGFFYTHHDGKRWWLVDPEGYAFVSAGICCISNGATGVYGGQEELFGWVPAEDDPVFAEARHRGRNIPQVDFLKSNLIQVYGASWKTKWEDITWGLLKHWRVNTMANWSDNDMARRKKIPYIHHMGSFPTTQVKLYRDFPDVFDPAYQAAALKYVEQLRPLKDDPYLIGYFLHNEPHWAFGDNNLAFEMFATATPSFTKKEMARWLQKKYGNIKGLNDAWKQNLSGFDALETLTMKDKSSDTAWDDCLEFSGLMVDRYVEVVCTEVRKVDPNHLNLGMRYAWLSSDLCYRAGAWFDVFSINGYSNPAPPPTDEIARRSGKPVIIGEWHFGCAIEGGLPASGIQGAESQTARGEAYRYYFEQGIARPELIGMHWFQWNDQPVFGRFDGENYNIGFLDICMQPYTELTDQAKLTHERMYRVAAGSEAPFDKVIRRVPQIFY